MKVRSSNEPRDPTHPADYSFLAHATADCEGSGFIIEHDGQSLSWPTLPKGEGLESINVVGVGSRIDQIQGSEFRPGARVSLLFEEDNPFDPNAISVWSADRRRQAGYIPKDEAPRLRKKLQQDDHDAFVVWENYEGKSRVGLRLLLVRKGIEIEKPKGLFLSDNVPA